ncbi:fibroblast growth factor 1 isoform X4 [Cyanistes caeruleus]|uniref:fibroblast growth factor 1 isoform X4 n=1 Tax=Cyanistes caeruleus TaxID=156563 RepID=UPI000CDA3C8B|nr:fibroblast growth factor 1 isoform X4 [Cyanistes caeruleus]
MAEGEISTFSALTEKFDLPSGNYKKPKLLYCSNGGHFLRILPDGTVDGTRDRSDQHTAAERGERGGGAHQEHAVGAVPGHGHQGAALRLVTG